jgi:nucleotide-binding universal stress UspA family protein
MRNEVHRRGERIVVGVDGSSSSRDALTWAVRQAHLTRSTLEIVMAWQWPPSYAWVVPIPDDWDPEEEMRQSLEAIVRELRSANPDLAIDPRLVNGHPVPVLVEASKGADLLVVGNRGYGEFAGMLLGSVSEHCATSAHCPVLVHRSTG